MRRKKRTSRGKKAQQQVAQSTEYVSAPPRFHANVGITPFTQVVGNHNVASLLLRELDVPSLVSFSFACKLNYHSANLYYWRQRVLQERLIPHILVDSVSYRSQISDPAFKHFYRILHNNRRFAETELSLRSKNFQYTAIFGTDGIVPFQLAALLGRIDMARELFTSVDAIRKIKSRTGLPLSAYLVFGQHILKLREIIASGAIKREEIEDTPTLRLLCFLGGLTGNPHIATHLEKAYDVKLKIGGLENIHIARGLIEGGHLAKLQLFLAKHDLSILSILKLYPETVHNAAENGHRKVVLFCLHAIAIHNRNSALGEQFVIQVADEKGRTLLHYFSYHGWREEFSALAEGAPVIPTPTPEKKSRDSKRKLRLGRKKHGASKNNDQQSPMDEWRQSLQFFIKVKPHSKDNQGNIPMHSALEGGHLEIAELCHENKWGDLTTITGDQGCNALGIVIAAHRNHLLGPLIHKWHADPSHRDESGNDALLLCANFNNWDGFIVLLPCFKTPYDSRSLPNGTPLVHVAAYQGHVFFLRQLKSHCHNISEEVFRQVFWATDAKQNSLLHSGCELMRFVNYANLLIKEFGCNLLAENTLTMNMLHAILYKEVKITDKTWQFIADVVNQHRAKIYKKTGINLLDTSNRFGETLRAMAENAQKMDLFEDLPLTKKQGF